MGPNYLEQFRKRKKNQISCSSSKKKIRYLLPMRNRWASPSCMRITARSALAVGSKRDLDAHIKYIVFCQAVPTKQTMINCNICRR
jgi:hypothetical protein